MKETIWIDAMTCENCGPLPAHEISGPWHFDKYGRALYPEEPKWGDISMYPLLCTLSFCREELHHPTCGGGRIMLAQLDNVDVL